MVFPGFVHAVSYPKFSTFLGYAYVVVAFQSAFWPHQLFCGWLEKMKMVAAGELQTMLPWPLNELMVMPKQDDQKEEEEEEEEEEEKEKEKEEEKKNCDKRNFSTRI